MALTTNAIGDIGEMNVSIRLTENGLFQTILLGGKVPSYDIIAEIIPDNNNENPINFLFKLKPQSIYNLSQ